MPGLTLVSFWSAPIETILAGLASRPDGLTQIEADRQRLRFGPNRSSDTRKITPLGLLLNQFRSPLVILLLFAMTLSLFLGETTDGVIVLAIVLGSALLGFLQEYRASNAVAHLLSVIQTRVTALRDGHEVELPHDALVVFAISWGGMLILVGPDRIPGTTEEVERLFPFALVVLFAGPSIAGILMTGFISGSAGLYELFSRLLFWRVGPRWYAAALLLGPLLVAAVLFALSLVSPVFLPGIVTADDRVGLLLFGLAWGLIGGGLLEELGWTGFAVPRLRLRYGALATGLIVGLLWGAWHFLIAFWASSALAGEQSVAIFVAGFLAFYVVALPAYRVLMVWVYDRSASLLVAMLMHAFLSASILILQPQTTAGHVTWNLVLGAALWVVVAAVAVANSRHPSRQPLWTRAA